MFSKHAIELGAQIVIPATLLESVLWHYHGAPLSGHVGYKKTMSNLLRRFWMPRLERHVKRWVGACLVCARRKVRRRFGSTEPGVLRANFPFDVLAIDTVGPLPTSASGNRWILTAIDCFTRFPIAVPLPSLHADVIARALFEHVLSIHSCPRIMLSDNASTLTGAVMTSLCKTFGIRQIRTRPYSPSLNSYVERWHGYMNTALTALTARDKSDWDKWISVVLLAYRTAVHSTTGFSPFQALFGRSPQLDIDLAIGTATPPARRDLPTYVSDLTSELQLIHKEMRQRTETASQRNLARRLKQHTHRNFNVGDYVFINVPGRVELLPKHIPRTKKLLDRFLGPYRIHRISGEGKRQTYFVTNPNSGREEEYRGEMLSRWTPWLPDGTPSVPGRRYFTEDERRTINKQEHKFVLPDIHVGDLIVFPRTMSDDMRTKGFGVARVTSIKLDGSFVGQWYSNGDSDTPEQLRRPLHPCWQSQQGWYASHRKRHRSHEPCLTTDYPIPITRSMIADAGFQLTPGRTLPAQTLLRMHEHPKFEWCLTADERQTLGLPRET